MTRQNHKRGFNLIEAAIVLGVVGLVVGGIWISASAVSDHFKVSKTASGLLDVCVNIGKVFDDRLVSGGTGSTDITSAVFQAGFFPRDWWNGSRINLPTGGFTIIYQWKADQTYLGKNIGGMLTFYLLDVPNKHCRNLVQKLSPHTVSGPGVGLGVAEIGAGDYGFGWTRSVFVPGYTGLASDACGSETLNKITLGCGY